jgi:hypothetical protein
MKKVVLALLLVLVFTAVYAKKRVKRSYPVAIPVTSTKLKNILDDGSERFTEHISNEVARQAATIIARDYLIKKVGFDFMSDRLGYFGPKIRSTEKVITHSDAFFLKKVGKFFSNLGKKIRNFNIEVMNDEILSDSDKFFKKVGNFLKKKVLPIATEFGKRYISAQTGIPLADAESETLFLKKVSKFLKKNVLPIAKEIGKRYLTAHTGIPL